MTRTLTKPLLLATILFGSILTVSLLTFVITVTPVFAHGAPELTVSPTTVAQGDTITVSADGVEVDGTFTVVLQGMLYQATLGTAQATDDAFDEDFTIPSDAPTGNYQVQATSDNGQQVAAELTISGAAGSETQSKATPAVGAMDIPRMKTTVQWIVIIGGLVVSLGLGLGLVVQKK
jgi:hypothetical protein